MTPERWAKIKELFRSSLDRGAGQRGAFLDEACAGDPTLRQEIESLLACDEQAGNFMQASAVEGAGALITEDRTRSMIGRRIGPYQVLREIGHGGMGAVYLATRADDEYRKQVAIKVVKRGMDTDAILRRFRNERQILANLDHPHIAKLLDGGTTEDGLSYFVMDYVEGLPIDVYCDTHKLATIERLKLFRSACSAVHYAHQHHVVHRDLKPSNILVTTEGVPKLLDFGIAKLLDPELSGHTIEPTAGPRPMTPQYASPEHVRGEVITPVSDVYSLGVLLYELLTGHRPYYVQSATPQEAERVICEQEPEKPSTVISQIESEGRSFRVLLSGFAACCAERLSLSVTAGLRKIKSWSAASRKAAGFPHSVAAEPPSPPFRGTPESVGETRGESPEKLRRQLRGDLDNIVLMAMRKEPGRRYASVEQFAEDIRRHLDGLPVITRKDTLGYCAAKFVKRNKVSAIAALIMVLPLAVIGLGLYRLRLRNQALERAVNSLGVPAKAINSLAVLPLENLSGDPQQDYFADGMTEALITDLAQIRSLRVISRTSVMQYKGSRKPLPEVARALHVDAVVEGSVLRSGERVRITAQLIQARTDRHLWAKTYERDLRDVLALQSEVASAIAQEVKVKLTPQEQVRMASSRPVDREAYEAYLKGSYFWNKRTPEGLTKATEFFQQAIEKDPGYALAYAGLAESYFALSFYGDVAPKQYFPRVKEAATKALEIDDTLAEAHASLASTLTFYDWDWPSAEREFRRALELNPSYAMGHRAYASYLSAMGRHREAIAEAKRAQELDPLSLDVNTMAGRCFYHARQYDQAIEQYRRALEIDPNFTIAHQFSGKAYAQKGMYREALAELQEAGAVYKEAGAGYTEPLSVIGLVYAVSGRPGQAQHVLEELKAIRKQKYVPPWSIVRVYAGLGQKDQAFAWLEKGFQERDNRLIWLKVDPMFDNLRCDPRFADLLRRLRFPP